MLAYETRSADGTRLRCLDWRPDGEPAAHLLLAHGFGEHLGRYAEVGATLAAAGVRMLGIELRGHGLSGGRRGHLRRWSDYGADLAAAAALLPDDHALLAHSTGALVALDRCARGAPPPTRIVFTSPLVGLAMRAPWWKKAAAPLLSVVAPTLALDNEVRVEDLSSDPEMVEAYREDALRMTRITPRCYVEMRRAMDRLWRHPLPRVPLQLHLAEDELLLDRGALARLEREWPGPLDVHRWEARHELLQDRPAARILELAKDFLLAP